MTAQVRRQAVSQVVAPVVPVKALQATHRHAQWQACWALEPFVATHAVYLCEECVLDWYKFGITMGRLGRPD